MNQLPRDQNLRSHILAAIGAARALCEAWHASTLDAGVDEAALTALILRYEGQALFSAEDDGLLERLAQHARADIARAYPAWAEALSAGRVPQDPLGEAAAEASRLLEALRDFRAYRQRVLDEVVADRLLTELQCRRVA